MGQVACDALGNSAWGRGDHAEPQWPSALLAYSKAFAMSWGVAKQDAIAP